MTLVLDNWPDLPPPAREQALEATRIALEGQRNGIAPAICHRFAEDAALLKKIAPFEGWSRSTYLLRRGLPRYCGSLAALMALVVVGRTLFVAPASLASVLTTIAGTSIVAMGLGVTFAWNTWFGIVADQAAAQTYAEHRNALALLFASGPDGVPLRIEPGPDGTWRAVELPTANAT
jgi:hypothetical protein